MTGTTNALNIGVAVQNVLAVLKVTAVYGSTVTATKGTSVITVTPSMAYPNAGNTESVYMVYISPKQFGTWTIASNLNGTTSSKTVSVSDNNLTEVNLL